MGGGVSKTKPTKDVPFYLRACPLSVVMDESTLLDFSSCFEIVVIPPESSVKVRAHYIHYTSLGHAPHRRAPHQTISDNRDTHRRAKRCHAQHAPIPIATSDPLNYRRRRRRRCRLAPPHLESPPPNHPLTPHVTCLPLATPDPHLSPGSPVPRTRF